MIRFFLPAVSPLLSKVYDLNRFSMPEDNHLFSFSNISLFTSPSLYKGIIQNNSELFNIFTKKIANFSGFTTFSLLVAGRTTKKQPLDCSRGCLFILIMVFALNHEYILFLDFIHQSILIIDSPAPFAC